MKNKSARIVWILILVLALCVPIHVNMTDGGSEGWYAVLWQLDRCHELSENGFLVGTRVSLLFGLIPVYDDTHEEPMTPSQAEPTASTREEPAAPNREEPAAPARGDSALSPVEALPAPRLVEEESFFSDFTVRGDRVYFLCRLCIRNPADQPQAVQVTGDFSEDSKGGLLAGNGDLYALRVEDDFPGSFLSMSDEALAAAADLSGDRSLRVLPLPPGDKVFWVLFAGDHGTAEVKQNRLLPPISIHVLAEVTPPEVLAETALVNKNWTRINKEL